MANADTGHLFTANQAYALAVAKRFVRRLPPFVDRDELTEAAMVGLWQACERFDAIRGLAFTTYAHRAMHTAMIDWLRLTYDGRRRHGRQALPFSQLPHAFLAQSTSHRLAHMPRDHLEDADLCEVALRAVSPRQRRIVRLYYWGHLTMGRIAEVVGCHENNVSRILKAAHAQMRERLLWAERKEQP